MAPPQRMRIANEKASKYVMMRGNVPKSSVIIHRYSNEIEGNKKVCENKSYMHSF